MIMHNNNLKTRQLSNPTKAMVLGNSIIALWGCHNSKVRVNDVAYASTSSHSLTIENLIPENEIKAPYRLPQGYKEMLSCIIENTITTIEILETIASTSTSTPWWQRYSGYDWNKWNWHRTGKIVGTGVVIGGALWWAASQSWFPWNFFGSIPGLRNLSFQPGLEEQYLDQLCNAPAAYLNHCKGMHALPFCGWQKDDGRSASCPTHCFKPLHHFRHYNNESSLYYNNASAPFEDAFTPFEEEHMRSCIVNGTTMQVKYLFPKERILEAMGSCLDVLKPLIGVKEARAYQGIMDSKALYRCDQTVKAHQEVNMGNASWWRFYAKQLTIVVPITIAEVRHLYRTAMQHNRYHQLSDLLKKIQPLKTEATNLKTDLEDDDYSTLERLYLFIDKVTRTFEDLDQSIDLYKLHLHNNNIERKVKEQINKWEEIEGSDIKKYYNDHMVKGTKPTDEPSEAENIKEIEDKTVGDTITLAKDATKALRLCLRKIRNKLLSYSNV